MATKTFGTGSGLSITPDYSNFATWETYVQGLGTLVADEILNICWASSANEITVGSALTFDGADPSTFNIILQGANGSGVALTDANWIGDGNPLRYDNTAGPCILITAGINVFTVTDNNYIFRRLQFRLTGSYGRVINWNSDDTGRQIKQVIIQHEHASTGRPCISRWTVVENLVLVVNGMPNGTIAFTSFGDMQYRNCTFMMFGATKTNRRAVTANTGTTEVKNCAFYGFGQDCLVGSGGTFTGNNNASDLSSGSSGAPTTGSQFSMTASNEFESITSVTAYDARIKSTSTALKNNGTSSGVPSTDIIGQSSSGAARDIGAWEYQEAGGGTTYDETVSYGITAGYSLTPLTEMSDSAAFAVSQGYVAAALTEMPESVTFAVSQTLATTNLIEASDAVAFGISQGYNVADIIEALNSVSFPVTVDYSAVGGLLVDDSVSFGIVADYTTATLKVVDELVDFIVSAGFNQTNNIEGGETVVFAQSAGFTVVDNIDVIHSVSFSCTLDFQATSANIIDEAVSFAIQQAMNVANIIEAQEGISFSITADVTQTNIAEVNDSATFSVQVNIVAADEGATPPAEVAGGGVFGIFPKPDRLLN